MELTQMRFPLDNLNINKVLQTTINFNQSTSTKNIINDHRK